jgi:glycogen synthase
VKIIHIHHHYWPVIGGLENVVKALAEGMAKLGHEVHVGTSTYGAETRPKDLKRRLSIMCVYIELNPLGLVTQI